MKIFKTKLFKSLFISFFIGLIVGLIIFICINSSSKLELENNLINYFELIKNGNFNYSIGFIKSIIINYKYLILIWILGIIFILSFVIPFIVVFRGVLTSFSACLIICTYKLKGVLYALILMFPCMLLNEFIYIFVSYYAISFSIKCFNTIKNNKCINLKSFVKNYFLILIVLLISLLISSLFEIYISSNIIKFVV